jgi:hypothetical protein
MKIANFLLSVAVSALQQSACLPFLVPGLGQHQLEVADVHPGAELEPDFLQVTDLGRNQNIRLNVSAEGREVLLFSGVYLD